MKERSTGWSWPGFLIMLVALFVTVPLASVPGSLRSGSGFGATQLAALVVLPVAAWWAGRCGLGHGVAIISALGAAAFVGLLPSGREMRAIAGGRASLEAALAVYSLFILVVAVVCGFLAKVARARAEARREQSEDVCPGCGYDLRGLVERRCPECGTRFGWRPPPPTGD